MPRSQVKILDSRKAVANVQQEPFVGRGFAARPVQVEEHSGNAALGALFVEEFFQ